MNFLATGARTLTVAALTIRRVVRIKVNVFGRQIGRTEPRPSGSVERLRSLTVAALTLRRVVCIKVNVFGRQIARPNGGLA